MDALAQLHNLIQCFRSFPCAECVLSLHGHSFRCEVGTNPLSDTLLPLCKGIQVVISIAGVDDVAEVRLCLLARAPSAALLMHIKAQNDL